MKTLVPLVPSWFVFPDVLQQDFGGDGALREGCSSRCSRSLSPLWGSSFFDSLFLGLTPQANYLSRLRRSPLTELLSRRLVPQ